MAKALNGLTESTPVGTVIGVKGAKVLADARGVHTVGALVDYLPRRYLDPGSLSAQTELVEGMDVIIVAEVRSATARQMRQRRQRMLTATVTDGRTTFEVTFFNAYGHERKLVPGRRVVLAGTLSRYNGRWQLAHPDYELLGVDGARPDDEALDAFANHLMPLYSAAGSLYSWKIRDAIRLALDSLADVRDPLPAAVRAARALPGRREALELVHRPRTRADVTAGLHRFRYDEAFTLQTVLAQRRHAVRGVRTTPRPRRSGALLDAFDARLPFELTAGQREVGAVLEAELADDRPMHRLLQGEVGSGKTVVALRAMLAVIDAGGQAALLAPTEVLAMQHHRSISAMLGDLALGGQLGGAPNATRVAVLTGSQSATERRAALNDAVTGDAGIVIGTHALIQDAVEFHDLGLVVIDEQHRFGVEQRDALRGKSAHPPHMLVMTATPIPRTVAMTVFGDMETSVLTELPAGRSPIATYVVHDALPSWVERTWARVAEEVAKGHQVYVVCPRIGEPGADPGQIDWTARGGPAGIDGTDGADLVGPEPDADGESDRRPMAGVYDTYAALGEQPQVAGLRLGMLHGRMPADEKDAVMTAFQRGEVDVLVATTVIEVGVDVPNATVMVIMDADRFGVSQLQQLRGRVGRGAAPGLCLLMTSLAPVDTGTAAARSATPPAPGAQGGGPPSALRRLQAVASTTDGLELARLDLESRREGDILGARQSGRRSQLRVLRILRDEQIIAEARQDAFALVDADPDLAGYPALAERVAAALDDEQAAYLERG